MRPSVLKGMTSCLRVAAILLVSLRPEGPGLPFRPARTCCTAWLPVTAPSAATWSSASESSSLLARRVDAKQSVVGRRREKIGAGL